MKLGCRPVVWVTLEKASEYTGRSVNSFRHLIRDGSLSKAPTGNGLQTIDSTSISRGTTNGSQRAIRRGQSAGGVHLH